jgi:hypothetical protein
MLTNQAPNLKPAERKSQTRLQRNSVLDTSPRTLSGALNVRATCPEGIQGQRCGGPRDGWGQAAFRKLEYIHACIPPLLLSQTCSNRLLSRSTFGRPSRLIRAIACVILDPSLSARVGLLARFARRFQPQLAVTVVAEAVLETGLPVPALSPAGAAPVPAWHGKPSRQRLQLRLGDGEPVARVVGVSLPRQGLPPLS